MIAYDLETLLAAWTLLAGLHLACMSIIAITVRQLLRHARLCEERKQLFRRWKYGQEDTP